LKDILAQSWRFLATEKMKSILAVVTFLVMLPFVVEGLSTGAPNPACPAVSPNPTMHLAQPQTTASPVSLSIVGDVTEYVPFRQYTLTFYRSDGSAFKGFLGVAQNMNGERVGFFTAAAGQKQTCDGLNGITHTDSNDKTMVNVTWTAPPACTGPVTFRFAAVEVRNMYWANIMGPQLNETTPSTTCDSSLIHLPGTLMILALIFIGLFVVM
jgi:hypothetical protein